MACIAAPSVHVRYDETLDAQSEAPSHPASAVKATCSVCGKVNEQLTAG